VEDLLDTLQKQLAAVESNFRMCWVALDQSYGTETVILGNQRMQREKRRQRRQSVDRRPAINIRPNPVHDESMNDVEILYATLTNVQSEQQK